MAIQLNPSETDATTRPRAHHESAASGDYDWALISILVVSLVGRILPWLAATP